VNGLSDKDSIICPVCGNKMDSEAEFCTKCDSPVDPEAIEQESERLEDSLTSLEEIVNEDSDEVSVCPRCGDFTRPSDATCLTCGNVLTETSEPSPDREEAPEDLSSIADAMFLCPECGAFLAEDAGVCDICGAQLSIQKRIGVGDFTADAEKEEKVCSDCGAYMDEGTGGCPICSKQNTEEDAETTAEGVDIEDDINKFLEELEATDVSEDTEDRVPEELVEEEIPVESEEFPIAQTSAVSEVDAPEPDMVEPPSKSHVRETAPAPISRRVSHQSLVQKRRNQVQSLQEFLAYSSTVAIAAYYVASQAGADVIHWIMLAVFGVISITGVSISLMNIPKNWKWALGRSVPFIVGIAVVVLVPVLHLMNAGDAVYSFGLPVVVVGGVLSFIGLAVMRRDFFIFLIWSAGSLLVFLMAVSALELPGTWILSESTAAALWTLGFLYLVLSVALLIRMKWIKVMIDTEILSGDRKYRERRFKESIISYDKAISASTSLKSSMTTSDNMDIPWYSKGAALTILGKYNEAIDCIDNALKLSPNNEVALVNKGMALSRLGRHREALKCYNEAIRVNPTYEVAWNNKGNALTRLHRYDEALKCYERAIQLDEEYREAWVNKGYVLAKTGDYDGAARCADFVSRFSTSSPTRAGERLIS
jgi:tetratricopeptide (TPR) repeat protein/predicted amidophosphoribosyltransferase